MPKGNVHGRIGKYMTWRGLTKQNMPKATQTYMKFSTHMCACKTDPVLVSVAYQIDADKASRMRREYITSNGAIPLIFSRVFKLGRSICCGSKKAGADGWWRRVRCG